MVWHSRLCVSLCRRGRSNPTHTDSTHTHKQPNARSIRDDGKYTDIYVVLGSMFVCSFARDRYLRSNHSHGLPVREARRYLSKPIHRGQEVCNERSPQLVCRGSIVARPVSMLSTPDDKGERPKLSSSLARSRRVSMADG